MTTKNRVEKYISIEKIGLSPSKKTQVWLVMNTRTNQGIGTISWHGPFRKYCFNPYNNMLFDADCMRLIADHTEKSTKEHYAGKKAMLQ